ncbi:hypothetical protein Taro_056622, partial [Colocasia esculenta]|nr:hypothetical protein [Colocasia esculenta]
MDGMGGMEEEEWRGEIGDMSLSNLQSAIQAPSELRSGIRLCLWGSVYIDFVMVVSTHPLLDATQDKSQEYFERREEERERSICIQRSRAALPRGEEGEEEGEEEEELEIAEVLVQKDIQPSLCNKSGHMKADCPEGKKEKHKTHKKEFHTKKNKAMVATWSDDESSDCNEESSSSEGNEICFMAGSSEEQ